MSSSSANVLDRAAFLAPTPRRYTEFVWSGRGVVRLQSLTVLEKSQVEAARSNPDGTPNRARILDFPARLIAAVVVDANNVRFLTKEDVTGMQSMDGAIFEQLFAAAYKHVYEGELSIEAAVKNFDATQSELSQSA